MNGQKIALLFFSRSLKSEAAAKRWLPNRSQEQDQAAASLLIEQAREAIKASGFPVFHFHEGNQQGTTFGARLANAYQFVFEQGYDAVIAVGNDSPQLGKTDWGQVRQALMSGRAVLGPSIRGGGYLIGLNKWQFDPLSFRSLPWQTDRLWKALFQYASDSQEVVILEELLDVNDWDDLSVLLKLPDLDPFFRKRLLLILQNRRSAAIVALKHYFSAVFRSAIELRGPPFALSLP